MEKKSTIQPVLTPLKAFYEKLSQEEQDSFDTLSKESLEHEFKLLEVLSSQPKKKYKPSNSSIKIILDYSKKESRQDLVY